MQLMVGNLRPSSHPIRRVVLPRISFVVARSKPGNIIGCENRLPWHLRDDLKHFRRITQGHTVILGRRTLDSIGKPLPNRINIVLSRADDISVDGIIQASSTENATFLADHYSILQAKSEYFIIGGAEIYRAFSELFDKIYLTEVFGKDIRGDATFDLEFDRRKWKTEKEEDYAKSEDNDHPFRITVFSRKDTHVRKINISEYMTRVGSFVNMYHGSLSKIERSVPTHRELNLDLFRDYADRNLDSE